MASRRLTTDTLAVTGYGGQTIRKASTSPVPTAPQNLLSQVLFAAVLGPVRLPPALALMSVPKRQNPIPFLMVKFELGAFSESLGPALIF